MIRSAVRNSIRGAGRRVYPHQGGRVLPRANIVANIPNRYPFTDRIGKHDGPAQLRQYAQVASGTITFYHPGITGSEIITSSGGDAPVSVVVGGIVIGAGTCWEIRDSAGHLWTHCAALSPTSVVMWDVSGLGDHLVAEGMGEAVATALCSTGRDPAVGTDWLDKGFTLSGDMYQVARLANGSRRLPEDMVVPAIEDGSVCAGYVFTGELYPDGAILHFSAADGFTDQTGNQSAVLIGSAYPTVTAGFATNAEGAEWGFDTTTGPVRTALLAGGVTLVQVVTLPLMSSLTDATDYSLFGDLLYVRRDGTAGSFKVSDGTNTATVEYSWSEGEVCRVVVQCEGDVMRVGAYKTIATPNISAGFTSTSTPLASSIGNFGFTRGSVAWYPDDNGVLRQYLSGAPATNANGLWIEPAATNLCANYNAAPDAPLTNVATSGGVLSRVSRATELATAGLADICSSGYAFSVNNNTESDVTVTITGQCGNAYKASAQCYARVSSGRAAMQLTGGAGRVTISETAFTRVKSENIVHAAATDQLQFIVEPGCTFEWVLNQLEVVGNASHPSACTSPVVTAGASATRAASFLSKAVPAGFPVNNVTAYFELRPTTRFQTFGNPALFAVRKDVNNSLSLTGLGSVAAVKKVAGTSYTANVPISCSPEMPHRISVRFSSQFGVAGFCNGVKGQTESANTTNFDMSSGTIYIGTVYYGDQYFIGQVKDLRVYYADIPDAELKSMTSVVDGIKDLGDMGVPLHEPASSRIWATAKSGANFDTVVYSDDNGDTWTTWTTVAGASWTAYMQRDSAGNIYVAGNGATDLKRIDAQTKAISTVILWNAIPGSPSWSWSWFPWHWAETSDGTTFTTAYQMNVGGQYIWKSTDNGQTWTIIDQFVTSLPACKHIHSMHCNPYDDKIYVHVGDDASTRGTFVSADKFATSATRVTDATSPGPTGLTFTSEAVWTSTDTQGNTNYLDSIVSGVSTPRWASPAPYQLAPLYYARACGDNEIWMTAIDDSSTAGIRGCLLRVRKRAGIDSNWDHDVIDLSHEPELDGSTLYAISSTGNGVIPSSCPYVFVERARYNPVTGLLRTVLRINRAIQTKATPAVGLSFLGYGKDITCDGGLPLSAQPCKGHAIPIGTGKLTFFPGVATAEQIEEAIL